MALANPIEEALREAGVNHWCTKVVCTTCGATAFRNRIQRGALAEPTAGADALQRMDLSAWYAVEHVGGAIAIAFDHLDTPPLVDSVLAAWRSRIQGHTRIVDSVVFHLVHRYKPSRAESDAWLALARAEALATRDPSLLETLIYTLGRRVASDAPLLSAAHEQRRGYAPLHRALNRMVGHVVREP